MIIGSNWLINNIIYYRWKINDTILQRLSPNSDGKYHLHLNFTRYLHNQNLSCSAMNSAGVSEDVVVLNINCMRIYIRHRYELWDKYIYRPPPLIF